MVKGKFLSVSAVILTVMLFAAASFSAGSKCENFVLYDLQGKRRIFYDLFEPLPDEGMLILNFTSINCKPCRKEIPELADIAAKSEGRAKLVCVYAEAGDQVKEVAASLDVLECAFVDPFGNIRKQHNVKKIPVTIIIDKKYQRVGRFDGYSEKNIDRIRKLFFKRK